MAQYATPSADLVDGTWTDEAAGQTDLYDGIVPGTPGSQGAGDDSTYIQSVANPSNAACAFETSNVEDPVSSSGHIMRYRRCKDASGGGTINLNVQIKQGYSSEGSSGTLITTLDDNNLSNVTAQNVHTLSTVAADLITDYTDLQVRFSANQA